MVCRSLVAKLDPGWIEIRLAGEIELDHSRLRLIERRSVNEAN